jgi:hypothetical protein
MKTIVFHNVEINIFSPFTLLLLQQSTDNHQSPCEGEVNLLITVH